MTAHLKKAELHCHIEGAAPPALALVQARKYNVDVSGIIEDGAYVWADFSHFLKCYDAVAELFRTEEDYALLAEAYLTELAQAGTIYSEIIVSPDHGNIPSRRGPTPEVMATPETRIKKTASTK